MTSRILPREDYGRLIGTDLETAVPLFPGARVIVVEEGDAIIGHLMLAPMWHAEGFYVAPSHRGRGVDTALVTAMHAEARSMGVETVFPAAADDQMAHYVTRHGGVEIPARWFAVAVQES
jgi:GNAT superfamily N-acetyltransferase